MALGRQGSIRASRSKYLQLLGKFLIIVLGFSWFQNLHFETFKTQTTCFLVDKVKFVLGIHE